MREREKMPEGGREKEESLSEREKKSEWEELFCHDARLELVKVLPKE